MKNMEEIDHVYQFLKESLEGRTFIGEYVEQSFVSAINCYRDVIVIDESELELKADLKAAQKLIDTYQSVVWSGITTENKQTKLWACVTASDAQVTFGTHSWTIARVVLVGRSFLFNITRNNSPVETMPPNIFNNLDLKTIWASLKEFSRFATVFLIICMYTVSEIAMYLYLTIYKIADVLPRVIDSLMPLFLSIVNGLIKCVGGLYILMAMIWNGNQPRRQPRGLNYTTQKLKMIK